MVNWSIRVWGKDMLRVIAVLRLSLTRYAPLDTVIGVDQPGKSSSSSGPVCGVRPGSVA